MIKKIASLIENIDKKNEIWFDYDDIARSVGIDHLYVDREDLNFELDDGTHISTYTCYHLIGNRNVLFMNDVPIGLVTELEVNYFKPEYAKEVFKEFLPFATPTLKFKTINIEAEMYIGG